MGIYVTIECDRCGEEESESPPVSYAKKVWREDGWRIGKETVCPYCREGAYHADED